MSDKNILEIVLQAKGNAETAVKGLKDRVEELSGSAGKQGGIFTSLGETVGKYKALVVGAAAALGVGAIVSGVKEAIDTTVELGKEVGKLQRMTGMTAEASSELIAVADQVGISFGTLENSVVAIARKMGGLKGIEDQVTDASGKVVDVFEKYDIQIKNSDGSTKSFSEVFNQLREKIRNTSSETERLAIATQFFRGGAAELLPLLIMTSEQYKEIAADAKKYGLILTQDNVNAVKECVMAHKDLDDVIQGAKISLGKELIPVIKDAIVWVKENSANIKEWAMNIGVFLVEAVKAASGALNILKAIALTVAAAVMEQVAVFYLLTGQIDKAREAHAKAGQLMSDAANAAIKGVEAYASLGESAKKSGDDHKKAADEVKKTIPTYEEWLKTIKLGSQEYKTLMEGRLKVLEAHGEYEKNLLAKQLSERLISQEDYNAAVKKLDESLFQAKLKLIDDDIKLAKAGGESKYAELLKLEMAKQELLEKHAADQVKLEMDTTAQLKKFKEDEFGFWKSTEDLKLQAKKAQYDLEAAMDDAAVKAGILRESTAMQNKLNNLREVYAEQIRIAEETAINISNRTGLLTEKDKEDYAKALGEKAQLQEQYAENVIASESQIAEKKKQEAQDAETFIADLLQDSFRQDEVRRQEQLDQLERFYQQGLISAEDYYDALNVLEDQATSEFKRDLQERSAQLNLAIDIITERRQRLEDTLQGMTSGSFDDIKQYFGDWKKALSTDVGDMQSEIDQFMRHTTMVGYNTFWAASLYGRRMVDMVGTSIYEWAQRVTEYVQYVKDLMASLQETIDSYRMELMQLRGDRLGELELWRKDRLAKLEEQFKDLKDTKEYYEALALLDELYKEKKKKILDEMKADEENAKEDTASGSSGGNGGLANTKSLSFPGFQDYAQTINQNINDMMQGFEFTQPEGGGGGTQSTNKQELSLNAQILLQSLDPNYLQRVVDEQLFPMLMRKFENLGVVFK
ncbi:MAG: hypothetical protein WC769_01590 [Thermodesulfovibrionales bacterium]|jgi:hypothetical protein